MSNIRGGERQRVRRGSRWNCQVELPGGTARWNCRATNPVASRSVAHLTPLVVVLLPRRIGVTWLPACCGATWLPTCCCPTWQVDNTLQGVNMFTSTGRKLLSRALAGEQHVMTGSLYQVRRHYGNLNPGWDLNPTPPRWKLVARRLCTNMLWEICSNSALLCYEKFAAVLRLLFMRNSYGTIYWSVHSVRTFHNSKLHITFTRSEVLDLQKRDW